MRLDQIWQYTKVSRDIFIPVDWSIILEPEYTLQRITQHSNRQVFGNPMQDLMLRYYAVLVLIDKDACIASEKNVSHEGILKQSIGSDTNVTPIISLWTGILQTGHRNVCSNIS